MYSSVANRRVGRNKCACGKTLNLQTKIRPCRGEFFLKIDKRACTSIWYTRVDDVTRIKLALRNQGQLAQFVCYLDFKIGKLAFDVTEII